jgi:hypothetical protein
MRNVAFFLNPINKTKQTMKNYLALLLLFASIAVVQSCKDDEDPKFKVSDITINEDAYTAGGTLKLLYSIDNGTTFTETLNDFKNGAKILVKINNGTVDLTSDDFTFDWSGSSPAPTSTTSDVAEFTATAANSTINVKVTDIWSLITNNRTSGKFYTLDKATGVTTEAFTPMYNNTVLKEVRGFVYHPTKKLYYASLNSYVNQDAPQSGFLFTIDPATKVATKINGNDGNNGAYDVWDAIVNWAVAADDSLVAIGDFNNDGNGVVKFGTDGGRSLKTAQSDICCGLGMIYDVKTSLFTIANYSNTTGVRIQTLDLQGNLTADKDITTFTGFTNDPSVNTVALKTMAKDKDGVIYGILFDTVAKKSFFVKVDLTALTITYIATLGADNANQYNSLTFIAKHLL